MSSPVDICNMALSHLALTNEIQALDEKSNEARACRRFYDNVRDQLLRDFPWPFATEVVAMGLVAEDPTTEWGYAYRLPTNTLALRRVLSPSGRLETGGSRVRYRLSQDATGGLIWTDEANAKVEVTVRIIDTELYPADVVMAFSLLLAASIAPRVTGGDQFKLGARAAKLYDWRIATAQANAANEEAPDLPIDAELIRERE